MNSEKLGQILQGMLLSSLATLAPIKPIMISVGILIFADLILGILASLKQNIPISSAALRRTVSKMVVYHIAILSGFLVEKYLIGDLIPATKLIAGVIGMVELKSILENSDIINGSPIFIGLIKKLGSQNDENK